jgi:hypothetical protein
VKRFITYLFTYENGRKGKNVGFIRTDIRGEQLELAVHVQGIGRFAGTGQVFLLVKDGTLWGIPLGALAVSQGRGAGRFMYDMQDTGEQGYTASAVAGIAIRFGNLYYAASSWNEEAPEGLADGNFEVWGLTDSVQRDSRADVVGPEEVAQGRPQSTPLPEEVAQERPQGESRQEELTQERPQIEPRQEKVLQERPQGAPLLEEAPQEHPHSVPQPGEASQERPQIELQPEAASQERPQGASQPEAWEQNAESELVRLAEEKLKQEQRQPLTAEESHGEPELSGGTARAETVETEAAGSRNSDMEYRAPRRIDISDIRRLPKKNWYLCNNSFLIHGFFNYRYLVLVEMEENGGRKMYLGVPGVYEKPERMMAMLFGFPDFLPEGSRSTVQEAEAELPAQGNSMRNGGAEGNSRSASRTGLSAKGGPAGIGETVPQDSPVEPLGQFGYWLCLLDM